LSYFIPEKDLKSNLAVTLYCKNFYHPRLSVPHHNVEFKNQQQKSKVSKVAIYDSFLKKNYLDGLFLLQGGTCPTLLLSMIKTHFYCKMSYRVDGL